MLFRLMKVPMTGESLNVDKTDQVIREDVVLADRINMVYSGSLVASGPGSSCCNRYRYGYGDWQNCRTDEQTGENENTFAGQS